MFPENALYYQNSEQINEDVENINAAKQDISTFSLLYDKYYIPVYRFIYNRVESIDIATDICSQTFLKAMLGLSKYKEKGLPFASWLFKIARNEINLHYRTQKNQRSFYLNILEEHQLIADFFIEEPSNPESILKPLLEGLSVKEMELIEMRYFEKISFKDISTILNMSENNAKVKVHRILKTLRAKAHHLRKLEIGVLFLLGNSLYFM